MMQPKIRQVMIALLVYAAILVVVYWPAVSGSASFFFGDTFSLHMPQKIFLISEIRQGHLPLWNPYLFSGMPFLADVSQAIFYPSTLLFLLFSPRVALIMAILVHFLLGGMGAYLLARVYSPFRLALIGGVIFMLAAPIASTSGNLVLLQSVAYLPWILFLPIYSIKVGSLKPAMLGLPIVLALSFLGGHPQPLIYALGLLFVYLWFRPGISLSKKLIIAWLPMLMVSIILSPLIIPFGELLLNSTRSGMAAVEALSTSVHPLAWLGFVVPYIFHNPMLGMVWGIYWNSPATPSVYVSLVGLFSLVVLFSKKGSYDRKWWQGVLIGSLIVSLGKYIPGFAFIYSVVPGLSMMRNWSLILVVWVLAAAVLVPQGLKFIPKKIPYKLLILMLIGAWGLYTITLFPEVFGYFWKFQPGMFHTASRDLVILKSISFGLAVGMSLGTLAWYASIKKWYFLVLVFVALDLGITTRQGIFFGPKDAYENYVSPQAKYLNEHLRPGERFISGEDYFEYTGLGAYWNNMLVRPPFGESSSVNLYQRRDNLAPDWQVPLKLASAGGYGTFILKDTAEYWSTGEASLPINWITRVPFSDPRWSEQSVAYLTYNKLILPGPTPDSFGVFTKEAEFDNFVMYKNQGVLPLVRPTDDSQKLKVKAIFRDTNNISFIIEAPEPGRVIVAERYYPGWTCQPNCAIEPTPIGMIVSVPEGNREINLKFQPSFWLWFKQSVIQRPMPLAL